jgi:hypothetical protein
MPDLNHSNKRERRFPGRRLRPLTAQGKGLVTYGARNTQENLPFLMALVEQWK